MSQLQHKAESMTNESMTDASTATTNTSEVAVATNASVSPVATPVAASVHSGMTKKALFEALPPGVKIPKKKSSEMTFATRLVLEQLLQAGWTKLTISKVLGYNSSSIYREVEKGLVDGVYNAEYAHQLRNLAVRKRKPKTLLTPEIKAILEEQFAQGLTPVQIVKSGLVGDISHQAIYLWIKQGRLRYDYYVQRS